MGTALLHGNTKMSFSIPAGAEVDSDEELFIDGPFVQASENLGEQGKSSEFERKMECGDAQILLPTETALVRENNDGGIESAVRLPPSPPPTSPLDQQQSKAIQSPFLKQKRGNYEAKPVLSEIEEVLAGIQTRADVLKIFWKHHISTEAFLRMNKSDFMKLGISDERDQNILLEAILEIHKHPFEESSLIQPPEFLPEPPTEGEKRMSCIYPQPQDVLAAQARPPEFNCLSLGAMLENVNSQLIHMESGLMTAERLLRAYDQTEKERYAYTEHNNAELVRSTKKLSLQLRRLGSRVIFMQDALKNLPESQSSTIRMLKFGLVGCVVVGVVGAVAFYASKDKLFPKFWNGDLAEGPLTIDIL